MTITRRKFLKFAGTVTAIVTLPIIPNAVLSDELVAVKDVIYPIELLDKLQQLQPTWPYIDYYLRARADSADSKQDGVQSITIDLCSVAIDTPTDIADMFCNDPSFRKFVNKDYNKLLSQYIPKHYIRSIHTISEFYS